MQKTQSGKLDAAEILAFYDSLGDVRGRVIKTANHFGINRATVYGFLNRQEVTKPPHLPISVDSNSQQPPNVPESPPDLPEEDPGTFTPDGNGAEFTYASRKPVATLDELLLAAKVDLSIWAVKNFVVNQWEMGYVASRIDGIATPASHPLFQVKAFLERIKPLPINFEPIQPVHVEIFHRVQPQVVETSMRRCAVIPDIQMGYRRNLMTGELTSFHDRACVDLGLQLIADMRPDVIVLLGDNLDLPEWSMKFLTSPECKQLTQTALIELAWLHGKLRAICPSSEIHYLEGNHELRMQTAVSANLAQAYGLRAVDQLNDDPALSIPRLLNLASLDVKYHGSYPQGRYRLNSNFLFHHGTLVRSQSGKTVAAMANDLRRNEGVGHIHRVENACKTMWTADSEPKVYQAWSFGTWASILPGRVPGNSAEPNWQNAMGDIWYEVNSVGDDGLHDLATVTAPLFYRDTAVHGGKRYQARPEQEIIADITAETGWDVTTGYRRRIYG